MIKTKPIKVIFLDIDGVLHSGVVTKQYRFKPEYMRNLQRIVEETGAKIVISSDWKLVPDVFEDAKQTLRKYGLEVFDVTPNVSFRGNPAPEDIRAAEIRAWLRRYGYEGDVTQYVVIDDYNLTSDFPENAVYTVKPGVWGLDKYCADKAIQILNKNDEKKKESKEPKMSKEKKSTAAEKVFVTSTGVKVPLAPTKKDTVESIIVTDDPLGTAVNSHEYAKLVNNKLGEFTKTLDKFASDEDTRAAYVLIKASHFKINKDGEIVIATNCEGEKERVLKIIENRITLANKATKEHVRKHLDELMRLGVILSA